MKTIKRRITWSFIAVSITLSCIAQTNGSGVGNEIVTVMKEYEAKIADAEKVNLQPNIPETEDSKLKLNYKIKERDFKDIQFEANPLKPLSMSKEKLEKYNNSFIKIAFGSQLMPLAQLAYNDNKTKNLKFGIFYNHLSAREFKVKNQRFGEDEAGVYLKYYPKKTEVGTAFTFRNYRTHFYAAAFDTLLSDSSIKAKDIRQVFRTYDAEVYFKNTQSNKQDIDYKQTFRFNYLQEKFGKANEWFVQGTTDIKKGFLKYHYAGLDFRFDVSRLKNDSLTLQRNIFTPMLGYGFNNDDWKAHGYIGVAVNGKEVAFATDVHAEKRMYQHYLILYADYQHNLRKNSLLSFSQTNNFIYNWVDVKNTIGGDFGTGVKGTIKEFSYNLGFHFQYFNRLPLFVNYMPDSTTTDIQRFVVIYDQARIFNFHFEAGYNLKEWLRLSVVGDYYHYEMKNETRAWHQPAFKTTFRANYIWKEKIVVGLDVYGVTAAYAKLNQGGEKKLKGTADLNISLEYIMNKHIAFFAGANNIANIKYQRWNNYQSYGAIGWIGAKFSF